ncbi:hypothetical protein IW140_005703 [Coemansia sp. RSA 1813]|nr:hypothetical protein LPJ74_004934 [Coemansia sp. RSA 1843]KAJ2085375.1 hypothetical protein IW138_006364 [Coemansia sp. RSA 986]KAJ2564557.1 hypothetical protein IW140_005703 [Coemansia sp. RSA 1813]
MHGVETRPKRKHGSSCLSSAPTFSQQTGQQVSALSLGTDGHSDNDGYTIFDDDTLLQLQQPPKRRRRTNKTESSIFAPGDRRGKKRMADYDNGESQEMEEDAREIARVSKTRRTNRHPPAEAEIPTETQALTDPTMLQAQSEPEIFDQQNSSKGNRDSHDGDHIDDRSNDLPIFSVIDIPLSVRAQAFLPSYSNAAIYPHPLKMKKELTKESDEEHKNESSPNRHSNNAMVVLYTPQKLNGKDTSSSSSMDID